MSPTVRDSETKEPRLGFWEFGWLFFMRPLTLHDRLHEGGVKPDASARTLWKHARREGGIARNYLLQSTLWILVATPALAFMAAALIPQLTPLSVDYQKVALGVAGGVAFGVAFGVAGDLAFGVAVGVAVGVALGVAFGVAGDLAFGVAFGVAVGVAGGVALGVAGGVAIGVALGVALGVAAGVAAGGAAGVAVLATNYRVVLYPFECLFWLLNHASHRHRKIPQLLSLLPFRFHELSYLPFPYVRQVLVQAAPEAPQGVVEALRIAERVPGQQATVAHTRAELWRNELLEWQRDQNWEAMAELDGVWLPSPGSANRTLLLFREAGRHARAASRHLSASKRALEWSEALAALEDKNIPTPDKKDRAEKAFQRHYLQEVIGALRHDFGRQLVAATLERQRLLPNPFNYTGNPLRPGGTDRAVFRGREDAVCELQGLLSHPGVALGVLGPRRAGKSSLLRMLPVLIPSDLFVYFDLQDNPIDSPEAFYRALDSRLSDALESETNLRLPQLGPRADPAGLRDWFEAIDAAAGNRRVIFCFDEYERMESLWPGDPRSFTQFLGLMRATIQHREKVRVLLSGASSPSDLGTLWTDHFISLQELRLDFLTREQTVDLLRQPEPAFPPEAVPDEIAQSIFALTAGQPYLTQLFGFHLVQRMNQEERRLATAEDVVATARVVQNGATNYFAEQHQNIDEVYRLPLETLARGQTPEWTGATRRWLRSRGYLNAENQLRVPLFHRWLKERLEDDE